MLRSIRGQFDQATRQLSALFPDGPRVAVIGSTDFWHDESERTCTEIGRLLATIRSLLLITGGVEGIGEATGRSFYETRRKLGNEPRIYHVLPEGEEGWDYGETFFVGADMAERREVLARLADLYVAIEGGPGTVHEVAVASGRGPSSSQ
jgi:predicted Rossmann-fold nucleotide-binding protein